MNGRGTLTRDQADVLLRYGWQTADMLLNPDEGISAAKASQAGSYGCDGWNYTTTSTGIEGRRGRGRSDAEPDVVVPWSLVQRASKALPDGERTVLFLARRRARVERSRGLPPYLAGGQAPWVAPPPHWLRAAEAAQNAALVDALDSLVPADELLLFEVSA